METPLGLHSTDNTMKPTLGCTHTKAQTLALYLVLFLSLCAAYPAQAQDIRWQQTNGPYGGNIQCFTKNGSTLFVGTIGGGVFRSTDSGMSWVLANDGLFNSNILSLTASSTGTIFAGTAGDGVFRSFNNGVSWAPINSGLSYSYVYALKLSSTGTLFAGTFGRGIFRSANNGESWSLINSGLSYNYVFALIVSSKGILFAGTEHGVFRSTNNGLSWNLVNSGLSNAHSVLALTMNSAGILFAGTFGGGVFRSVDNGESWVSVRTGLSNYYVSALTASGTGMLFAGTSGGVFRSSDNGTTWQAFNSGMTSTSVSSLVISGSILFAGTERDGVFKADISNTPSVSVRTSAPQPASVTISFAPHPALDRTRLTLNIPRASLAEVRIFDVLGRLVQHTALGELSSGTHEIEQDLRTLPNGTYSVVVQAGSERVVKLLLVRR